MIRNVQINGLSVKKWINLDDSDQEAITWIWNQLMGETAKGDTLEFVTISRVNERLYAGLLKGKDNSIKGIVPAIYEKIEDGLLKSVDYKGCLRSLELDTLDPTEKVEHTNIGIDNYALQFLL